MAYALQNIQSETTLQLKQRFFFINLTHCPHPNSIPYFRNDRRDIFKNLIVGEEVKCENKQIISSYVESVKGIFEILISEEIWVT